MSRFNKILYFVNIAVVAGVAVFIVANIIFAWNSPTASPPNPAGQAMYVGLTGNVGIGMTNPQAKLAVELQNDGWNGYDPIMKLSAWQDGINNSGNGGAIDFYVNNQTANYPSSRIIHTMSSGTGGELSFATTDNYTTTLPDRKLVIKGNGNVGIGTASPTQKLDVAGYINGQSGLCIGGSCRSSWQSQSLNRTIVSNSGTFNNGFNQVSTSCPSNYIVAGCEGYYNFTCAGSWNCDYLGGWFSGNGCTAYAYSDGQNGLSTLYSYANCIALQ